MRARFWLAMGALFCLGVAGCAAGSATPSTGSAPTRTAGQLALEMAATARAVAVAPTEAEAQGRSSAASTPSLAQGGRAGGLLAPPSTPVPTATRPPATRPVAPPRVAPSPSPTAAPLRPAAVNATPSPTPGIAFPKDRAITYVAIGASDTVGVGAKDPAREGWVGRLHSRLPAGSRLVNLGASGARLSDARANQLPRALESAPDLVTIWNVVNDFNANVDLASYALDLDRILRELTTRTSARVLIANAPDLALVPAYIKLGISPEELRREISRWNAAIALTASRYPGRVQVVDLFARSAEVGIDDRMVAGDEFHPSTEGYARIAEVFWEFMVANRLVAG